MRLLDACILPIQISIQSTILYVSEAHAPIMRWVRSTLLAAQAQLFEATSRKPFRIILCASQRPGKDATLVVCRRARELE